MASLPVVGGSAGAWGTTLNQFLETSHEADGTLKATAVSTVATVFNLSGATVFSAAMTAASTFQDLDLSSVVGANTALVFLEVVVNAGGSYITKPKGYGAAFATHSRSYEVYSDGGASAITLSSAYGFVRGYVIAVADSSGVIQHGFTDNSTTVTLKLIGYIK